MAIIYFILALAATTAGALAGIGGGIIIKPVLDVLGQDNLQTISVLSSATVFAMSVVSTIKQLSSGFRIEKRMIFLAIGAAVGGIIGGQLFSIIAAKMDADNLKSVQALLLAALLTMVLFRKYLPDYEVKNRIVSSLTGLLLGLIAAFIGIGGGPINVVVLCMILAVSIKDAAVISILIILFSQGAKLVMIQIDTGFLIYENLHKLWFMIPGGIAGGLIGAHLNRKLSEKVINTIFNTMIICMICLNMFNAINALFFS